MGAAVEIDNRFVRNLVSVFGLLILLSSCVKNAAAAHPQSKVESSVKRVQTSKKMVKIDAGSYRAFIGKDSGRLVKLSEFYIDDSPVTNSEYLQFLKANPDWTKSSVLRLYADSSYLKNWKSDFEIPKGLSPDAPVTNVSWFAAEAYAQSVGKRLPTVDEWEFVARADELTKDASGKPEFTDFILKSYQKKNKQEQPVRQGKPNVYGVYDLYGMVWEWTYDFNSVMISGESRKDNSANESLFCAGGAVTSTDLRNYAAFIRFALRGSVKADYALNNLGFRCAKTIKN